MAEAEQNDAIVGFVTLHVPSLYSYLRIIRQSVMDMCARAGLSEFETAQVEMAVDEAGANIIEHSYGGEAATETNREGLGLRLNLVQKKDRIIIEIYDYGKGFDFDAYTPPDPEHYIEEGRERGLGLYIIRRFVDEVAYERGTHTGNCLRLTKYL